MSYVRDILGNISEMYVGCINWNIISTSRASSTDFLFQGRSLFNNLFTFDEDF